MTAVFVMRGYSDACIESLNSVGCSRVQETRTVLSGDSRSSTGTSLWMATVKMGMGVSSDSRYVPSVGLRMNLSCTFMRSVVGATAMRSSDTLEYCSRSLCRVCRERVRLASDARREDQGVVATDGLTGPFARGWRLLMARSPCKWKWKSGAYVLRSPRQNMHPQHVTKDEHSSQNAVRSFGKRARKPANLSSAFGLVHVLSNKASGFHV